MSSKWHPQRVFEVVCRIGPVLAIGKLITPKRLCLAGPTS